MVVVHLSKGEQKRVGLLTLFLIGKVYLGHLVEFFITLEPVALPI
jgi:hypothetical protein